MAALLVAVLAIGPKLPQPLRKNSAYLKAPPLVVRYSQSGFDQSTRTETYDGAVEAKYDVTTIYSDHLQVDESTQTLVASGHVRGVDPDFSFNASIITLHWGAENPSVEAENVEGRLKGFHIWARKFTYESGLYELDDVIAKAANGKRTLYTVRTHKLTLIPNQESRIEKPTVNLFGITTLRLPTLKDDLSEGVSTTSFPLVTYRTGSGFGINYSPSFKLDPRTVLATGYSVYQESLPRYALQLSHSLVPLDVRNQGSITPASDLAQRFGYGYFDSVGILNPQVEYKFLSSERNTISIDSIANQGASERLPGGSITKLAEGIYERGGQAGIFGYVAHARFQDVREQGETDFISRSEFDLSVGPKPYAILKNLEALFRFDTQDFVGPHRYGWIRSQTGVSWVPTEPLRLSAAMVSADEYGTADLLIDRLTTDGGLYLRSDLHVGSTQFSYLVKYTAKFSVYDDEYALSEALGSFRVNILYRLFPNEYKITFGLRFSSLQDLFARRRQRLEDLNAAGGGN